MSDALILEKWRGLTKKQRQEVSDFADFLASKYAPDEDEKPKRKIELPKSVRP